MSWHWHERPKPDQEYLVMATQLELESWLHLPRFLWHSSKVIGQLKRSNGLMGFRVGSGILSKIFFTVSVWKDEKSLSEFAYKNPHAHSMVVFQPLLRKFKTNRLKLYGSELPVKWHIVQGWFA